MVGQDPLPKPGCQRGVRGKILFNGSWVQDMPWPEGCCYGVAKAGLALMARDMAQELAVHGIRVNVLAPGIVMAGLSKVCYDTDPNFGPRATAAIPLREFGTPEQCADAFLFLASDESDYITGVTLLVDGVRACRGGINAMRLSYVLPDPALVSRPGRVRRRPGLA